MGRSWSIGSKKSVGVQVAVFTLIGMSVGLLVFGVALNDGVELSTMAGTVTGMVAGDGSGDICAPSGTSGDRSGSLDGTGIDGAVGGGEEYVQATGQEFCQPPQGSTVVNSRGELVSALSSASSGDVVYIEGSAEIDMTGQSEITVPGGVTVASDRGCRGSDGAHLYKNDGQTDEGIFGTGGEGVRISGLHLEGYGPEDTPQSRSLTRAAGIMVNHDNTQIDNNIVTKFVGRCIVTTGDAHVHHNEISWCNRLGYGYGVAVVGAEVLVEANHFYHYRHAIAGGSGYTYYAHHNVFGPGKQSSDVDMHGSVDTECSSSTGGEAGIRQEVTHNTFVGGETYGGTGHAYIGMRGEPRDEAIVENNWFYPLGDRPAERAVRQSKPEEGECQIFGTDSSPFYSMTVNNNHYGEDEPDCSIGAPRDGC